MKYNQKVEEYLKQLLAIGLIYLFVDLLLIYALFKLTFEVPLIYFPIVIVSSIIGYIATMYIDPGGHVNYHLTKHTRTKDEENLYNLVVKYRSKRLISLVSLIVFIIFAYSLLMNHYPKTIFSFDLIVGVVIFPGLTFGCIGTAVKYITAWWNIKIS
jgi:hypothetical protein